MTCHIWPYRPNCRAPQSLRVHPLHILYPKTAFFIRLGVSKVPLRTTCHSLGSLSAVGVQASVPCMISPCAAARSCAQVQ